MKNVRVYGQFTEVLEDNPEKLFVQIRPVYDYEGNFVTEVTRDEIQDVFGFIQFEDICVLPERPPEPTADYLYQIPDSRVLRKCLDLDIENALALFPTAGYSPKSKGKRWVHWKDMIHVSFDDTIKQRAFLVGTDIDFVERIDGLYLFGSKYQLHYQNGMFNVITTEKYGEFARWLI